MGPKRALMRPLTTHKYVLEYKNSCINSVAIKLGIIPINLKLSIPYTQFSAADTASPAAAELVASCA
jgi:hypothetical protein